MSNFLVWDIVKRNNCFLMKRGREQFSKDPLNLKGKNCFKYSGLVQKKAIGIKRDKANKGIAFVAKRCDKLNKPAQTVVRTNFTRGKRRTLQKIRNFMCKQNYRRELKMLALRRASALMKNQKQILATPVQPKKN